MMTKTKLVSGGNKRQNYCHMKFEEKQTERQINPLEGI